MFTLQISKPDGSSSESRQFQDDKITIGRTAGRNLTLQDRRVSSNHAVIRARGGTYWLEDQNSHNGTELNDEPIAAHREQELQNGDRIRIGPFELTFRTDASTGEGTIGDEVSFLKHAEDIASQLRETFAREFHSTPSERMAAMKRTLDSALQARTGADEMKRLNLLSGLSKSFGATAPGAPPPGSANHTEPPPREELFVASLAAINRLSTSLIDKTLTKPHHIEHFASRTEVVFDEIAEWLPKLFQIRQLQKEEFSVDHTSWGIAQRNTLRASKSAAELLKELLDPDQERDHAKVRERLEEAFSSLVEHQKAMLEALEESLRKVLGELDPDVIEQRVRENSWAVSARLGTLSLQWKDYVRMHGQLVDSSMQRELLYDAIRSKYLDHGPEENCEDEE